MSHRKIAFKLPGDHIDFNLNLKINHCRCLMLKKALMQKKTKLFIFWPHLFRPIPNTGGQENRNYELRVLFCNSPIYSKKTNY